MNISRQEYRELFDASYGRTDDVFSEKDDREVIGQLIMFFGFSEPKDYFDLPEIGRMTVALGNFDEAFQVRGFSEFLENCGYCVPEMPRFLREIHCFEVAEAFEKLISESDPKFWGLAFFDHEYDVTVFCRDKNWPRNYRKTRPIFLGGSTETAQLSSESFARV